VWRKVKTREIAQTCYQRVSIKKQRQRNPDPRDGSRIEKTKIIIRDTDEG
jgi:hypothetical protein